jgi:hypothetical protein
MKQFGNKITSSKFKCVASGQKWSLFAAKHTSRRNDSIFTGGDSYRWWQILVVVTSRSNKDGQ